MHFNMRPYSLVEQLDTQKFGTLPLNYLSPPKKDHDAGRYGRFYKMKWKVVSIVKCTQYIPQLTLDW